MGSIIRRYNLDAYRNTQDLRFKVISKFDSNNLLMTCYDASLLLLSDIYHSKGYVQTRHVDKVNLDTLVDALATKHFKLENTLSGYDRLYHTYCLVYDGYNIATEHDVDESIVTLQKIVNYYVQESNMESLVEICDFYLGKSILSKSSRLDTSDNRESIAALLNLNDLPLLGGKE